MTYKFEKALIEFIKNIQNRMNMDFEENYPNLEKPVVVIEPRGRKYKKIVVNNGTSRYVHSFVEIETGDIFKAASWRAPAKHVRGNIYEDRGDGALLERGLVRYLR